MIQLDEGTVLTALKWLAGLFATALGWKGIMKVRQDRRGDRADGTTADVYERIVKGQAEELIRVHASNKEVVDRLEKEINLRHEAENREATLQRKLDHAQARAEQYLADKQAAEESKDLILSQYTALEMQMEKLQATVPKIFKDEM